MEEVDNILIQQLREIGCEFDDQINGIKELEVHQIMSCVCHCIELIKANNINMNYINELPSKQINESMNMSIKYKIATQLANICAKELGYKSDVGYQTFLYGNESDVRKVFLFLLERLPKDEDENKITNIATTNYISDRIKKLQITAIWLPLITDSSHTNDSTNLWSTNTRLSKILNIKSILMNRMAPNRRKYFDTSLKLPSDLPSIMEWNCLLLNSDTNENQLITKSKKVKIETIDESLTNSIQTNDNIDGSLMSLMTNNEVKQMDAIIDSENILTEEEKAHEMSKEEKINLIIEQLNRELKTCEEDIAKHKSVENQLEECQKTLKEETKHLRELEMSDKTQKELISEINEVKEDIEKMSQKWQQIQNSLSNQLKQLKIESQAKNERSTALQRQLNELKKSITAKVKEIKIKESLVSELTEKLPQQWPPSRSSYTKRILEIVANVKKQNDETKKVLLETRALQKEINNLSGKLSRTFTIADEEIFKDAKTNEWNRKCYKLLASMHDHCDQLLEAVSSIGFILREIRQLEESVETERSRKTSSNLNRILADLDQIKLENQQLSKKIDF